MKGRGTGRGPPMGSEATGRHALSAVGLPKHISGTAPFLRSDCSGHARQHRGRVEVESKLNRGTAFRIYTSGYSPGMAGRDSSLLEGRNFLPKPYSMAKLAKVVRDCLDRPAKHNGIMAEIAPANDWSRRTEACAAT
jgi:hypothetical protein